MTFFLMLIKLIFGGVKRVSRKLGPRKRRPQTLKTQTSWVSRKLRPSGCLENSDPKDKTNLDSARQRMLQGVFCLLSVDT